MSEIRGEERWVEVPGGEVYVRTWTPRSAQGDRPILLLHDSLGCVGLWRDFPERLARRLACPVIAYDRLGFGKSTARRELPSLNFIEEEAEVVFPALRQALGLHEVVLFGHSVGGAMALRMAALLGEPCRAVVTESTQAFVEERTLAGIRQAQQEFEKPESWAKLVRWHGDKSTWVLRAWTEIWLSPAFSSWSLEHALPNVRCPVLAIHGDRDEFGSAAAPGLIGRCVGGRSEVALLENCGHVPHREQPEAVLDRVARFLGRWAMVARPEEEAASPTPGLSPSDSPRRS